MGLHSSELLWAKLSKPDFLNNSSKWTASIVKVSSIINTQGEKNERYIQEEFKDCQAKIRLKSVLPVFIIVIRLGTKKNLL